MIAHRLRLLTVLLALAALPYGSLAQALAGAPSDLRAQKALAEATDLKAKRQYVFALDSYRKADKLDGNRCSACAREILNLGQALGDFKAADSASQELITLAATPQEQAAAHVERAELLLAMGKAKHKPECFAEGQKETESALAVKPDDGPALYVKGRCLASEEQDDAARQVFASLLPRLKPGSTDAERVARFRDRPELVRARMAPAFSVTTIDGKHVSLDELQGKVVLIDFWATWCGPCREALPHVQRIAKEFAGQPLVVLSISLDSDEAKWKDFVAKNNMSWLQYRDGGFTGTLARTYGVEAIPHTFTIDSDGVLQDEHVGDAGIDGKLRKLIEAAAQREKLTGSQQVAAGSN